MNGKKSAAMVFLFLIMISHSCACQGETARGKVFEDRNKNGIRDQGEVGLAKVCVSNGSNVVETDGEGNWALPISEDSLLFVIKPSGHAVPVDSSNRPQFYYNHKPAGSPPLEVPGVAPTGPLPESIDFPLSPASEPHFFDVLLFGDPQARGMREVDFVTHDVVEECLGTRAKFGVVLGDIVADDPGLFVPLSESLGQIPIPWHYLFGNHDHNRDAEEDRYTDETFERVFGPATYAFEYAQVCFIAYDNVAYKPEGGYDCRLSDEQIAFTREYLTHVPEDRLVVLLSHIPLVRLQNKEALFSLIANRPHSLSISAHYHQQLHLFLNEKWGWPGKEPHHHFVAPTVSGSWWCGLLDEMGIPHATMNDGGPNGYTIATFNGNQYSLRFKAARRPEDYQMNIYLAEEIRSATSEKWQVLVNVFAGSERSKVEMRVGESGEWALLSQTQEADPQCHRMHALTPYLEEKVLDRPLDEVFGWAMDEPRPNPHMWKGNLPAGIPPGTHTLTVRTTDMFGRMWEARRVFRAR